MFSGIDSEWLEILQHEDYAPDLAAVSKLPETTILPARELWFNWARLTPLSQVRVVIIGQDPYHTPGFANGLAFSSAKANSIPPSLKNIYKCLVASGLLPSMKNVTADLSSWARQGVLLLNTAFTVKAREPRSHSKYWQDYFDHVLYHVLARHRGKLAIVCWGNDAKRALGRVLSDKARADFYVLEWCHPSPYNGDRFTSCTHFRDINSWLEKRGEAPINWASIMN